MGKLIIMRGALSEIVPRIQIKNPTYAYEIFNFALYKYFYEKRFAFMRREFQNFLEKFIAGDFLEQTSLFHNFD